MLDKILAEMAERDGTDLFLTAGLPPMVSVNKELMPLGESALEGRDIEKLAAGFLTPDFERKPDLDLAYSTADKERFRINVFRQRGQIGMVVRRVRTEIQSFEALGLPPILGRLALEPRGLLLVTGATGSGKSTTLASMIDHRNSNLEGHIVTIEDPIEFYHPHKRSIVSQREVGIDTACFHDALRSALRQAPDLLLIGEIRDRETAEAALHFAETGHLVMATLHSTNAAQTLERLINLFPRDYHPQLLLLLSLSLVAVVSQRLVSLGSGRPRVPAIELLLPTPRMRDLIKQGDLGGIKAALGEGGGEMVSFDESLYRLVKAGRLTKEQAMPFADSPSDLKLKFALEEKSLGNGERRRIGLV